MFTLTGELDPGTFLLQRCRMCGEAELCQEVEGGGGVHFSQWQGLICDGKSLCQTASRVQSYFCLFQGSSGVSQKLIRVFV